MQHLGQQIERYDLSVWERDLEGIFGRPHKLIAMGTERFHGTVRAERFGNITVNQLFTEFPLEVRSTVLRASPNPHYHIHFIDQGALLDADGLRAPAHTMMLVNGHRPYHARQSAGFRSLVVTLPAALARSRLPDIDDRCGFTVSSERGPQRVLHDYVISLLNETASLPPAFRDMAENHLLDLLCAAAPGSRPDDRQGQCPRRYIAVHLSDPELSPQSAARALGVSVRTIHARMAQTGTSFASELRERRLQRCREELSRGKSGKSITDIAMHWGFASPSGFSRLFRARFGMSPRECRTGRQAAAPDRPD